jgi:hypothetical protein
MYKISEYVDLHMFITIISSVGMVMAFLGIFFFTYAATVEQEIVQINASLVVEDLLDVISPILDDNTKASVITKLKYPDMHDADNEVYTNNKNVTTNAMGILAIIFVVLTTIGYGISYISKNNYMNIIGLNLIILIFIGLTEYTFLNMIVKKFIAVDTNYIRLLIVKRLKEKFNIAD